MLFKNLLPQATTMKQSPLLSNFIPSHSTITHSKKTMTLMPLSNSPSRNFNNGGTLLPSVTPNAPAATNAVAVRTLPLKVSAKGAVSVYGLGRFPVTLYTSQMLALLANRDAIVAFIEANSATLTTKA